MSLSRIIIMAAAAVAVAAACAATLFAQAADPAPGSLAELTAEIRQLRISIEQASRSQAQAQALGVFLSAQDRRVLQVTSQLDIARRELASLSQQSAAYVNELAQTEEALPVTTDPAERKALEGRVKEFRAGMKSLAAREQEARTREAEMAQAWQQEDARWNDLIARLQQIVER